MACARSHGNITPAVPPAAFGRSGVTGGFPAVVVNVFSISVAIVLPLKTFP
jgi:hypothetical protein